MDQLFLTATKKEKKQTIKFILSIFVLFLLLLFVLFLREIYLPYQSESEEEIIFNIEKGQGFSEISSILKEQGIIRSGFIFDLTALLYGTYGKLQAGTYYLSPSMSVAEIIKKISAGKIIKEKITIVEGWTLKDIAQYFEEKEMFQAEELFEMAGADFSEEFVFLKEKPKQVDLEGYLFPDTYEIKRNYGLEEIIKIMLENFNEKVSADLRQAIKGQSRTLFDVLTMASLLEKEIKNYEEKRITAGILWKRLRSGWPLQVDATLTYITGRESSSLTKDDLKIDSLYNTYKYYGLPLGPICNPGFESIKAAVYYQDSPYWFYLTADDGATIFSQTFDEHIANKIKYLK